MNKVINQAKQTNSTLNVLKGVACIGVVFIHFCIPGIVGECISKMAQFAVPLFFLISGFFSFNQSLDRIKNKTERIFRITIVTLLIYFVYSLLLHVSKNNLHDWLLQFKNVKYWLDFFLLGNFDHIESPHLWFLPALIYGYLIIQLVIKLKWNKYIGFILLPLFLLKIIITIYIATNNLSWHYQATFYLNALQWMFLGYFIADKKKAVENIRFQIIIITGLTGLFLSLINLFIHLPYDISSIGIILYSTAIFVSAIKKTDLLQNKFFVFIGEKLSLYIYISYADRNFNHSYCGKIRLVR